jgi:FkbM family methyltransferase
MIMREILKHIVKLIPLGVKKNIKNIPLLKQLQQILFSKYLSDKTFIDVISSGPAKGLFFPVTLPQDKLMWIGTWELDFALFLKSCIRKNFICFDVGGYKGYYTGIMALAGAKEVHVFEPMQSNIESIRELISLNDRLPITLHEIAISHFSGKTDFQIMPDATMGKLISSEFQKNTANNSIQVIECNSLDNLIESGLNEPDFIKVDVEGAEIDVLMGALQLIKKKKPILLIEIHSHEIGMKCYELLKLFYTTIYVFETNQEPGNKESEICHYVCLN